MVQVAKLPEYIKKDLRESLMGPDETLMTIEEADININAMSAYDAFEMWLEWNGIIGYARTIVDVYTKIGEASH